MTTPIERFEAAATDHAVRLGPARLRTLATRFETGTLTGVEDAVPGFAAEVEGIVAAASAERDLSADTVASYLRGVATALTHHEAAIHVESVWSGPTSHAVPVRSTAQVLTHLVGDATRELLMMTYSARQYEPLREALRAAVERGATVRVVVETLVGAGSSLNGEEPADAFRGLGVEVWHWPVSQRPHQKGMMHAKIAVADRRELFVSSANLTQSGIRHNIEAGLLVRGGTAAERAAEHFDALRTAGILERW